MALWFQHLGHLGVLILFIAAHNPDPFGIDITLAGVAAMALAYGAVLVNLLLTLANRTQSPKEPGWLTLASLPALHPS